MDHYAVIGHPVAHSLSPGIHARFAAQTGQDMDYIALEAPLDAFESTARKRLGEDLRGANVTVPFKEQAARIADRLHPDAERAGAVNTLRREADGTLSGFNTDGTGLVRDLVDGLGCSLADARVVLVGAGGAAAGVIGPLCAAGVARLYLVNRTAERAVRLAARFADQAAVEVLDPAAAGPADLVINATSASLHGAVPALPDRVVCASTLAYDMMYADGGTPFLAWAGARGAGRCADGLGMLVRQAAAAFELWRGVAPDVGPVLAWLRPPAS